ncbi:MAG: hypothetical protein M3441_23355 [Chloroflexota bacterium]|nr:hypothetical protein [Chloroflexota bacterium]
MVSTEILADNRHETTLEKWSAIRQRTTRVLLTFNGGGVHRLEGDVWAVPSSPGGFHQVDLGTEVCDCKDCTFFGREHGVPCRHVYAAAIANAARRSGVREVRTTAVVAGDPFAFAAKRASQRKGCPACFGGYVTITVEEDGAEHNEAVPCRRCS